MHPKSFQRREPQKSLNPCSKAKKRCKDIFLTVFFSARPFFSLSFRLWFFMIFWIFSMCFKILSRSAPAGQDFQDFPRSFEKDDFWKKAKKKIFVSFSRFFKGLSRFFKAFQGFSKNQDFSKNQILKKLFIKTCL